MKNKFPAVLLVLHLLLFTTAAVTALLISNGKDDLAAVFIVPVLILIAVSIIIFLIFTRNTIRHVSNMNAHLESSAAEFMNTLPAAVAVIDEQRRFVW